MAGESVNIETDVLSKYAAQQSAATGTQDLLDEPVAIAEDAKPVTNWLTTEYLLENGY
jgi:hypothetical protein